MTNFRDLRISKLQEATGLTTSSLVDLENQYLADAGFSNWQDWANDLAGTSHTTKTDALMAAFETIATPGPFMDEWLEFLQGDGLALYPRDGLLFKSGGFTSDNSGLLDGSGSRDGALGGACYNFLGDQGTGSYPSTTNTVDFGNIFDPIATADFTICGWTKIPVLNNLDNYGMLISKTAGSSNTAGWRVWARNDTGNLEFELADGVARANASTSGLSIPVNDNRWHFVCLQIDRTAGFIRISLDNSSFVETDCSSIGSGTNASSFRISGYHTVTSRALHGKVQDWRVFTRIASSAEITKAYNGEVIGDEAAHWKMNEGAGQMCLDSSGNNVHGNLYFNPSLQTLAQTHDADGVYDYRDKEGYRIADGSTYYRDSDDTDLIANTAYIPVLNDGSGVAAYTAGGVRATAEVTGKARYDADFENSNCITGDNTDIIATIGTPADMDWSATADEFTISCWVNSTDVQSAFIAKGGATAGDIVVQLYNDTSL